MTNPTIPDNPSPVNLTPAQALHKRLADDLLDTLANILLTCPLTVEEMEDRYAMAERACRNQYPSKETCCHVRP